ncbi:hypothetical protein M0R45_006718 [Rubus argutus]|uniref:Uncharacterized protein n=1 Tax=Rubus argutus TaxID=59490 RepID=A0AAW1YRT8_RUBAR
MVLRWQRLEPNAATAHRRMPSTPSPMGTTNMRTHLLYQCRKSPLFIPSKKQRYLAFDSAENGGNVIAIEFDKDTSRFACAKMIIKDELPFSYVEGQGFVRFYEGNTA